MAIAFGATLGTTSGPGAAGTTLTLTTTGTVPSGGFIVVPVWFYLPTGTVTLSGGGLTWTTDAHIRQGSGGGFSIAFCSAQAPSGLASGTVLTATFGASADVRNMAALYYTGVATSSPKDVSSANSDGAVGGAVWATANLVTTNADDLLIGASMRDFASVTSTPAASHTERFDFVNAAQDPDSMTLVDRIVSATGTYTPGGTWSAGAPQVSGGIAYKADAGGPTTVSGSDSATETDAGTVSATASGSQMATGTDAGVASVTGSGSETGSGTDGAGVSVTLSRADTATATDSGTVVDLSGVTTVTGSDSGVATDTGTRVDVTPAPEPPLPTGGRELGDETPPPPRFVALYDSDRARARDIGTIADLTPPPAPRPRPAPVQRPRRPEPQPAPPPVPAPAPARPVPQAPPVGVDTPREPVVAGVSHDELEQVKARMDRATARLDRATAEAVAEVQRTVAEAEDWRVLQMLGLV